MPKLTPSKKFLEDIEKFQSDASMRKKIAKTMAFIENNPLHPACILSALSTILAHGRPV